MRLSSISIILFIWSFLPASAQDDKDKLWQLFSKTTFASKYYDEVDMYLLTPTFSSQLKQLEDKRVELTGYHIPFKMDDPNVIILSKYPFSQCFFCGGAGPESVAEVFLKNKSRRLKPDEVLTVLGTLKLNAVDINHVNFLIEDAEIVIQGK